MFRYFSSYWYYQTSCRKIRL